MKTLTIILFNIICCTNSLIAQYKPTGRVYYKCSINIGLELSDFDAHLYFNRDTNYFQTITKPLVGEPIKYREQNNSVEANYTHNINDSIGFKIISDKIKRRISSREIMVNKLVPVIENIPNFNWKIDDETKKIGDYNCQKATCTFRGRNYIAWFASEISVDAGPYKFQGLPGLILEVVDDKNLISFTAVSITYPFNDSIPINPKYTPEPITRDEYVKMANESMDKLSKFLKGTVRNEQMKGKITVKAKTISLEDLNEPF